MSISHLFPQEGPTLNLNFAGSRTLDPRITFTRTQTTSNGSTYMGRDGLVKYAGPDEARFDHRYVNGEVESLGLLIEEQSVNLLPYSIVTNTTWSIASSTVTNNATTAPDGNNTAARIQVNTTGYVAVLSIPVTAGQPYTFSFWGKSASGSGTWGINWYEVVTGHNRTTVNLTEEWNRFSITFTPTQTSINVYISDDRSLLGTIFDGYVWGAQLEQKSFATSLIPTEGSTKTRTKDVAYIDKTNFTEWYNQSEGTFFTAFRQIYDASATNPSSTKHVIQAGNDVTVNDNYTIRAGLNSTSWTALIRSASPSSLQFPGISGFGYLNSSTLYKAALSIDISLISVSLNGLLSADVTNTTTVNHTTEFNKLFIGSGTGGGPPYELCGTIAQITYYPTRLTNSQLISLTR